MRVRPLPLAALAALLLLSPKPASALPKFAREYHVGCETCHSIPPRLNTFGLAFQANFFNWPGDKPPKRDRSLKAFPISGLVKFGLEDNHTDGKTTAGFQELYLFAADGFTLAPGKRGGFFLKTEAATNEEGESAGALADAFVGLPFAGKRGQWAVTAGQFTPVMYQYDPVNMLTDISPRAIGLALNTAKSPEGGSGGGGGYGGYSRLPFAAGAGGTSAFAFSFMNPTPSVAINYFDGRGRGTADGNYVTLGMPFGGALALNDEAALHGGRGAYVHGFHRNGYLTYGAMAWVHGGSHVEGLIGTLEPKRNLFLLAVLANGHDANGATRRASLEAEYVLNPQTALTGRLEARDGDTSDVGPVAAVTYYPFKHSRTLRLSAEAHQLKGDRAWLLFARGQF